MKNVKRPIFNIVGFLLVLLFCNIGYAQNMVPNPSFEIYNRCPGSVGGIVYSPANNLYTVVANWISPMSASTPDYFNRCAGTASGVRVPYNMFGNMQPHSGNGYAGMYLLQVNRPPNNVPADYREYIGNLLTQPMISGHQYAVSFYVSFAKMNTYYNGNLNTWNNRDNVVATDQIGVYFSVGAVNRSSNTGPIVFTPSVSNLSGNYITDTTWLEINGIYTATGGEQWITIGNFIATPNYIPYRIINNTNPMQTYMYIDDVCVLDMTASTNTTRKDTVMCGNVWTLQLEGRPSGKTYIWNTGDTTRQIVVDTPGIYWVGTFGDCIYSVDTIQVGILKPSMLYLGADTVINCGDSIVLAAKTAHKTYSWNTGETTSSIIVREAGTYILTITDSCSTQVDTINVRYGRSPMLDIGRDTAYCNINKATLSANHNYLTYRWSTGDSTKSIIISQDGVYILTVSDSCGTQSDTVNVIFNQVVKPVVSDSVVNICQYTPPFALSAQGNQLTWYYAGYISDVPPTIQTDMPHTDTVYVSQKIGNCESRLQSVVITVIVQPTLMLQPDTTLCKGDKITIGRQVDGVSYNWSTGYSGCCVETGAEGLYTVQIDNICGEIVDSINISLADCLECIWAPNAFTPNLDGKNDVYNIVGLCPLQEFHLLIVNRWGQVMYETTDINKGWDGNYKSEPMPIGTYFYIVDALPGIPQAQKVHMTGDITLIR